jgi:hypothetical protein
MQEAVLFGAQMGQGERGGIMSVGYRVATRYASCARLHRAYAFNPS